MSLRAAGVVLLWAALVPSGLAAQAEAEVLGPRRVVVPDFQGAGGKDARARVLTILSEQGEVDVVGYGDAKVAARRLAADLGQAEGRRRVWRELHVHYWLEGSFQSPSQGQLRLYAADESLLAEMGLQARSARKLEEVLIASLWHDFGPHLSPQERQRQALDRQRALALDKQLAREAELERQAQVAAERAARKARRLAAMRELGTERALARQEEHTRQVELVVARRAELARLAREAELAEQEALAQQLAEAQAAEARQAELDRRNALASAQRPSEQPYAPSPQVEPVAVAPGPSASTQQWLARQQRTAPVAPPPPNRFGGAPAASPRPKPSAGAASAKAPVPGTSAATRAWLEKHR